MATRTYDVLVIGSGAAGSAAAKELTEQGLEVLLLEAGPNITEEDFKAPPPAMQKGIGLLPRIKAALKGQPIQARASFFAPHLAHLFVNDWQHPYTSPEDAFFLWFRGRQLGGRLHTYGRMLLRMSDYDFKAGSRDGLSPDWPIAYADLAPYYDKVEKYIGVYGNADGIANVPDGNYCHAGKLTQLEQEFKAKIEGSFPGRHVISWRYAAPNLKRTPIGLAAANATGRLTIRTDAVVKRITTDAATGKATGAEFIDRRTRQSETVSAGVVMLCASTIESIRILLNSACPRHPSGLGNSSGLLGRYFMDQAPSLVFGEVPHARGWEIDDSAPYDPVYPPAGGIYIPRYHNLASRTSQEFGRGFAFQGVVGRPPVPDDAPSNFGMMGFGESLPHRDNLVALDARKKDAWGIPAPHIRCALTANEVNLVTEQLRACLEMSDCCGFRPNFAGSVLGLHQGTKVFPNADPISRWMFRRNFRKSMAVGAAIHECGGARMGATPHDSVLNAHNQCWDAPNLFVTDASSFVTSATVGPVLTIMALSTRAGEFAAREYKAGRL